jgi:MtfA peptidase
MLLSWLKNRRRRKILAEPFPSAWLTTLQDHVGHYALLSDAERRKLHGAVQILLAEKEWKAAAAWNWWTRCASRLPPWPRS